MNAVNLIVLYPEDDGPVAEVVYLLREALRRAEAGEITGVAARHGLPPARRNERHRHREGWGSRAPPCNLQNAAAATERIRHQRLTNNPQKVLP